MIVRMRMTWMIMINQKMIAQVLPLQPIIVHCKLATLSRRQKPMLPGRRYRSMSPAGRQSLQFYNECIKWWPSANNFQCCRATLEIIGFGSPLDKASLLFLKIAIIHLLCTLYSVHRQIELAWYGWSNQFQPQFREWQQTVDPSQAGISITNKSTNNSLSSVWDNLIQPNQGVFKTYRR